MSRRKTKGVSWVRGRESQSQGLPKERQVLAGVWVCQERQDSVAACVETVGPHTHTHTKLD